MGLLEDAHGLLAREDVQFVSALDQAESDVTNPWTLQEAFFVVAGCHRKAGPFGYWQHAAVTEALTEAWRVLGQVTPEGLSPQGWASARGRTKVEVIAALDRAIERGSDVVVPSPLVMRPWCSPAQLYTCRMPYLLVAAVMHAWTLSGEPLVAVLDRYDVRPMENEWAALTRVERDIEHTEAPLEVKEDASLIRRWMAAQEPEIVTASRALRTLVQELGGVTPSSARVWLSEDLGPAPTLKTDPAS